MVAFKPTLEFLNPKPNIAPLKVDDQSESQVTTLESRYKEVGACIHAKVVPPQLPLNSNLITDLDTTLDSKLTEVKDQFDEIAKEIKNHPSKGQAFAAQKVLNATKKLIELRTEFKGILCVLREILGRGVVVQNVSTTEAAVRVLTIIQMVDIIEQDRLSKTWSPFDEHYHAICDSNTEVYEVREEFIQDFRINQTKRGVIFDTDKTKPVVVLDKLTEPQGSNIPTTSDNLRPPNPPTPIPDPAHQLLNTSFGSMNFNGSMGQNYIPQFNPGPGLLGSHPAHQIAINHPIGGSTSTPVAEQPPPLDKDFQVAHALAMNPTQFQIFKSFILSNVQETVSSPIMADKPHYPPGFEKVDYNGPVSKNGWSYHIRSNNLETFTGEPEDMLWILWWNRFYSVVHRYTALPEDNKFDALMMSVDKGAKQLVEGHYISLQPDRYKKAVAALHARYGDASQARIGIEQALQTLQPQGTTENDYQQYFTKVDNLRLKLITCGENDQTATTTAYTKLRTFAPQHAMREFNNELIRSTPRIGGTTQELSITKKYDMLLRWLRLNIQSFCITCLGDLEPTPVAETASSDKTEFESNNGIFSGTMSAPQTTAAHSGHQFGRSHGNRPWKPRHPSFPTKRGIYPQYKGGPYTKYPKHFQNRVPSKFYKCVFHKSDEHFARECPLPLAERIAALDKSKRCRNCCFKHHTVENCPSKRRCRNCKLNGVESPHNTLICPFKPHPKLWDRQYRGRTNSPEEKPTQNPEGTSSKQIPQTHTHKTGHRNKPNPNLAGVNLQDACYQLQPWNPNTPSDDEESEDAADVEHFFQSETVATEVASSGSDSTDSD
jgi:hypothetical protein